MTTFRGFIFLSVILMTVVGCKKDNDPAPQSPGGGAVTPSSAPNSIVSFDRSSGWWRDTSMTNSACLDGTTLFIECHPSMTTLLTFEIPNYVGPGTYVLGPQGSARYYDQLNTPAGSYHTQGTDSSGFVVITSFSEAAGLSGSFAAELFRGSTIQIENGVMDGVRRSCALPDPFLVYSIGVLPAVTPFNAWTSIQDVTDRYSIRRMDDRIVINHFNQTNIPTIGPMNTFRLVLPRNLEVGTYDATAISGLTTFELTFSIPSQSFYRTTHASNTMDIQVHDREQRRIQGALQVQMSGGVQADVQFDVFY